MTMIHFNWVDYCIFAVIFISMLISFFRGFIREAVSLCIWIVAIILALKFATDVGGLFQQQVPSEALRFTIAFIAIFLVIIIIGMVINALVRMLLDKTGLSIIDRLIGLIFGFARGILFVAMLLTLAGVGAAKQRQALHESYAVNAIEPIVSWLSGFVPQHIDQVSAWIHEDSRLQQHEANIKQ